MVRRAARVAGFDQRVYHGTDRFGFTKVKTTGIEEGVEWSPFFTTLQKEHEVFYRAYDVKYIEKIAELPNSVLLTSSEGLTEDNPTITHSVSDLYKLVKTYDKNFHAGKEVSQYLLNEDGTPKVFYHGAKKNGGFTEFRNWQYFTDNQKYAERYAERGNEKSLYEVYLFLKMRKRCENRIRECARMRLLPIPQAPFSVAL